MNLTSVEVRKISDFNNNLRFNFLNNQLIINYVILKFELS